MSTAPVQELPTDQACDQPAAELGEQALKQLRLSLLDDGWKPLEKSNDFRGLPVRADRTPATRTIVYVAALSGIGHGVGYGWLWRDGTVEVPAVADYHETWAVTSASPDADMGRWT